MSFVSARLAAGQEMAKALIGMGDRVNIRVQRAGLREAAEPMRAAMSARAPVEPGKPDLKDTMTVSLIRKGSNEFVFDREEAVAVGPSLKGFYGLFQEFGTVFHSAQPFARPAFDSNTMRSLQILSAAFWAAIAKARGPVTGIGTGPGRNL